MISQSKGLDSNLRNNNPAMINDLTGADDDYYDEEDYGQEVDNSKRVPEEEYDFMWAQIPLLNLSTPVAYFSKP